MNPKDQLTTAWKKDPMLVLVIGSMAATAAAKIIDAVSAAQGRRAYAKSVNHRIKMNRKKK